jgi:hypothetical protein
VNQVKVWRLPTRHRAANIPSRVGKKHFPLERKTVVYFLLASLANMKMEIRKREKCETKRKKIDDNKKENILS